MRTYFTAYLVSASILSALLLCLNISPAVFAESETQENEYTQESVLISEVLTRTEASAHEEFVELYNPHSEEIDISTWQLEYQSPTGSTWSNKIRNAQHIEPNMVIPSKGFYVFATENYSKSYPEVVVDRTLSSGSAEGGGHIRLLRPDPENPDEMITVDIVSWGDVENKDEDSQPAEVPPQGQSISRCFDNETLLNSGDNSLDFKPNDPSPGIGIECPKEIPEDTVDPEEPVEEGTENDNPELEEDNPPYYCQDVMISELLPNPQGPRSEHPREDNAYIELLNPTEDFIPLVGCGLQTTSSDLIFWFGDITLEPAQRIAFFERESGLQLPVSPSGTVYLLAPDETELTSTTYPSNSPEGASWAWFGEDEWKYSYAPSPGEENTQQELRPCPEGQERNPETNRCRNIESETTTLQPCGEGRERNPETNRCRDIASSTPQYAACGPNQERNPQTNRCRMVESATAQLAACGPGRERNPETNRCRNIASAQPQYVPCGPNQERNPETNRCRLIETASSELVPCGPGQERNPETNRCRRVAVPNEQAIAGVQDVNVIATETPISWRFAIFVGLLALIYGIWEWRYDIKNAYHRFRD